jgi:hypothetical protein
MKFRLRPPPKANLYMLTKLKNWLSGRKGLRVHDDANVRRGKSLRQFFKRTQGMTSFKEVSLLYELAREAKDGCIVEVGSYRGRSTVALGLGSMDGNRVPVFAIDPHEEFRGVLGGQFGPEDRGAFFRAMLDTACYQVVRLVNLSSEAVAARWTKPVDLLWIDGDHSYEGVKRDFSCWSPHLTDDAMVAFDDATDPTIGPHKMIAELLESGLFQKTETVNKITVLKKMRAA